VQSVLRLARLLESPPMAQRALEAFVDSLGDTLLDWRYKGFATLDQSMTVSDVQRSGVDLHELGTPMMTIDESAVAENLLSMASWCRARGLELAPHGKTTMAPTLWLGQLLSGCVGITVANAGQVRAARAFGVPSVVLANELVSTPDILWVAAELERDPDFDFVCWVDSAAGVARIGSALAAHAPGRPIPVCVEVGAVDGRTGARSEADVLATARAAVASERVALAGVSCFEGAVPSAPGSEIASVNEVLSSVGRAHELLSDLYETPRVTVTAGGSGYFDRVEAILGPLSADRSGKPVDVVLRSGAYVVHDDVHYRDLTPSTRGSGPPLRAAIHVWSQVLSRPQPDLVLLDAGKRDLPFDLDLPVVLAATRSGSPRSVVDVTESTVLRLNDQHCFVRVPDSCDLAVGDVVKLGLSHPCTAFDKWRAIAMVDSADRLEPRLTDVVLTFF
jgi:D-serine deaminase-like pyridoxal phosphate-dependent protein